MSSFERGDSATLSGLQQLRRFFDGTATWGSRQHDTVDPTAPVNSPCSSEGPRQHARRMQRAIDHGHDPESSTSFSRSPLPDFTSISATRATPDHWVDVINVKLASEGGLTVFRDPRFDPASAVPLPSTFKGIGLIGGLTSVTGTYTFHLGPVQRQLNVQRGGTIQFNGDLNSPLPTGVAPR